MIDVIKTCSCGASFTAEEWRNLPGVGRVDDGEWELDLRNCVCRSTLAVLISVLEEDARLEFEEKRSARVERLYNFAFEAMRLAKRYRRETGSARDHRVTSTLRQIAQYRHAIKRLRNMTFASREAVLVATVSEKIGATGT